MKPEQKNGQWGSKPQKKKKCSNCKLVGQCLANGIILCIQLEIGVTNINLVEYDAIG